MALMRVLADNLVANPRAGCQQDLRSDFTCRVFGALMSH
jgi:hypothetical protein